MQDSEDMEHFSLEPAALTLQIWNILELEIR